MALLVAGAEPIGRAYSPVGPTAGSGEDAQAATVERRAAQSADRVMFEILVMAPRYRVWPARAEAAPAWAVMLPLLVCTASTMMTFQEPLAWTVSWLPSAMAVWP